MAGDTPARHAADFIADLAIILELQAVEIVPALEELLGRDDRSGVGTSADDIVWADELLQVHVKDAIARLRST